MTLDRRSFLRGCINAAKIVAAASVIPSAVLAKPVEAPQPAPIKFTRRAGFKVFVPAPAGTTYRGITMKQRWFFASGTGDPLEMDALMWKANIAGKPYGNYIATVTDWSSAYSERTREVRAEAERVAIDDFHLTVDTVLGSHEPMTLLAAKMADRKMKIDNLRPVAWHVGGAAHLSLYAKAEFDNYINPFFSNPTLLLGLPIVEDCAVSSCWWLEHSKTNSMTWQERA